MDYAELNGLRARIQNRLVLNLSSIVLTPDQLSLLQLGVGFRPYFTRLSQSTTSSEINAADCAVQNMALAIQIATNQQQHMQEMPTTLASTKQEDNP